MTKKVLFIIIILFFGLYVIKANFIMWQTPFYDFDEAHRAENAKRMKEYKSPLVPLTGSVFDRIEGFRVDLKEDPRLNLYYHLERPTFIYWLMMVSTSLFDNMEWSYRFPSFLLGMGTILIFVFFAHSFVKKLHTSFNYQALTLSLTSLLTTSCLWLSSMYAQLDTGLTFFLFLAVASLIIFCQNKSHKYLVISALSLALAVLSKGQPAVIFIFPLLFLGLTKKMAMKELLKFIGIVGLVIGPWLFLLSFKFGLVNIVKIFTGFAVSSAIVEYLHHHAPIFWYSRWWWDAMRPGWTLFLALFAYDLIHKNFNLRKNILLSFVIGGFIFWSINQNKIWWYVLPLVPAISFYIFLSSSEYLKQNANRIINLSLVTLVASLPIFLGASNKVVMLYGILITLICAGLLLSKKIEKIKILIKAKNVLLFLTVVASLSLFYLRFPQIVPYHRNTKEVASYFDKLPWKKCLWFKNMPPEAALFYSNAGEMFTLTDGVNLFPRCSNYLITPDDIFSDQSSYFLQGKMYYLKDQKIVLQKGNMKLIKLLP